MTYYYVFVTNYQVLQKLMLSSRIPHGRRSNWAEEKLICQSAPIKIDLYK